MTRVLAVVGRSIMVSVFDVRPNDIMSISDDERDPIVDWVEHNDEGQVRFHYKPRPKTETERHVIGRNTTKTMWMPAVPGEMGKCFIHDLMNERREFNDATIS